jgi:hypothetical protein
MPLTNQAHTIHRVLSAVVGTPVQKNHVAHFWRADGPAFHGRVIRLAITGGIATHATVMAMLRPSSGVLEYVAL